VALTIGTVIGGRYRLDRLLGEGGMGQVWAATHNITGGRVALKFVKAVGDAKAEVHKRFLREARAATLVEHPNVVTIRDVFDHDETPVIVMDLLHGETLAALLSREGKLELGDAARLILPVIAAVGAAHEAGLIHRDLKPENVFLSKGQTGEMVRVLDFGIAKLVRRDVDEFASTAVTQSGTVIGTPAYMAPEQLFGEKDLDYRADVWAIGVMIYEMLAGHRPVDGDNFGQLAKKLLSQSIKPLSEERPDLPDDVVGIVMRMLARERNDRLSDLREAADVLARHGSQKRPSFGAPRARPLEHSSQSRIVIEGTDPNAKTMQSGEENKRRTDPSAETVLAQSNPPRHDTAAASAHVTGTRSGSRSWTGIAIGGGIVAAIAIAATRFIPHTPTPVSTPIPSSPLIAPPVVTMVVMPSVTATPGPTAPASTPPTPPSASVSATTKPVTTAGTKPIKPVTTTTASTTAPPVVTVAPPTPTPSATTGSGLVTKPPF
jgi:eukaryotic-like serine/threonine-protein kinase